jgi:hypothetical protein
MYVLGFGVEQLANYIKLKAGYIYKVSRSIIRLYHDFLTVLFISSFLAWFSRQKKGGGGVII